MGNNWKDAARNGLEPGSLPVGERFHAGNDPLQVSELRQWTWLWEPKLGGIEVKDSPLTINYKRPKAAEAAKLKGPRPY